MKSLFILLTIFKVAFVGDPQVDNATELGYARKSIYKELRERKDLDLVIVLGDLVNDDTSLLPATKQSLDSLSCPWLAIPGNHDRNVYRAEKGRARDLLDWKKHIGYVDTSFVAGGVRFILMNNVRSKGSGDYEAGFNESQKSWLQQILAGTPSEQSTVIATHIPLTEMHAQDSLIELLAGKQKLLLVSAHTHQVKRETLLIRGNEVENLVAGASCGSWWRGIKDNEGVPDALMNCGSPRCYFIADFNENDYELSFKQVGDNAQASATLMDDGRLIINVFGGSKDGKLSIKAGRRLPKKAREVYEPSAEMAPEVAERIEFNSAMSREYRREHKEEFIPLLKRNSPHVWVIPDCERLRKKKEMGQKISVSYSDAHMNFNTRIELR